MKQTAIPYLFIRGGTSRGPYFNAADLPRDRDQLSRVLISVVGAGNPRNIDGIGGGNAVTTKVAMLSPSDDPKADVDYFFAQVAVDEELVDYAPTCGNILANGKFVVDEGTADFIDGGVVNYDGDTAIDGVPGTAAPVALNFLDVVGSRTGALFPTGKAREEIDGVEVSLVDVAMPMMIARAADFGITGYETQDELDAMPDLFARMEAVRLEAGRRMGFGDVSKSVTPKIGLLAAPQGEGHFCARYFMPWTSHPTLAVTGSQCLAACALAPGTVAEGLTRPFADSPVTVRIEHPMGVMDVRVRYDHDGGFNFRSAGVTRTARLIARGEVMVPASVWGGL